MVKKVGSRPRLSVVKFEMAGPNSSRVIQSVTAWIIKPASSSARSASQKRMAVLCTMP